MLNPGGKACDEGHGVTATSDGGFIVACKVDKGSFGTGTFASKAGKVQYDAVLIKYNISGNVDWISRYGTEKDDYFTDVQETTDGYVAVSYGIIAKYNKQGVLQSSDSSLGVVASVCILGDKYICTNRNSIKVFNSNCESIGYISVAGEGYDELKAIAALNGGNIVAVGCAGKYSENGTADSLGNGFWKGYKTEATKILPL